MNSITDFLEITLKRSLNLQISSVAFPVGSKAFLPAGHRSLVHAFTWHSHPDVDSTLFRGRGLTIAQSIATRWTFREDPGLS